MNKYLMKGDHMAKDWEKQKENFKVVDVRNLTGNFLPGLLSKAGKVEVGDGVCVVQSFEPIPLYSAMADLGFERLTEKISDNEYRVYFYRTEKKEESFTGVGDMPLKPTAILNFKKIDNALADVVVNFWNLIWGKENTAIDQKTKLLLSLANGVGAGRYRQATRELVKAYALGVSVAELDELFSMFVWNGGVGTFASEIGPSSLFGAYQLIKALENKGKSREEVMSALLEKFGEKNPEVNVMFQDAKGK
jgi:alkylhydroperoxidase/carboxymuconolactone decarboxylase family protein YurZ